MTEFFGSVWWLIVSLGLLVTFHEFGHYWVGRRFGVKVLRFSVGFGSPLWKRIGKDGTEWVVAALPLGGYVKFLDEREGEVPREQLDQAFTRKSVGQRFAIVAAGPAFNLILAIFLLWVMFLVGKGDYAPIVGRSTDTAAAAGLQLDDRLLSIDGEPVATWTQAGMALTTAVMDRRAVEIEVERDGARRQLTLDLSRIDREIDETRAMRQIGLIPRQLLLPPVIGAVLDDGAAARAGLREGDRILALGGRDIEFFDDIPRALAEHPPEGGPIEVTLEREGRRLDVSLSPTWQAGEAGEGGRWLLGVQAQRSEAPHDAILRYGPGEAVGAALRETWRLTEATLGMLYRMVTGVASLQNLSGPISIAQYANASAQMGAAWFFFFLAVLSLSLCIMNLLPIPILDGGHLLYYLIEMIKGSPVSERMLVAGQYVGLAFLAGLMGLAFYNDIVRLVG
ncbi:RIP metalloprotease RseP [Pseudomarimonas salicorniae]|uniref:Zinc metalloprotease n=1 Tax=Pseudomarimonas salicorniae TaxID=2933270 RepID=A0ABT0GE46_9GAMM|nr:RIP metalloprotease RseP [Lysobacter sp. CAU 1642]MCK7592622.1 RIP metalloprotease RseP [Lysobacter sp. CAU 1642]